MTNNDFNKIVDEQMNYCQSLLCKKGAEYNADFVTELGDNRGSNGFGSTGK